MNRLCTHYGEHVKDLNAALKDNSSDDAREALSLLQSDGVAQVMSFMSFMPQKKVALTLVAASPEMRLDVNVLTKHYSPYADWVRVRVVEQRLILYINATEPGITSPALVNSLWWAERRGMAVKLDANSSCNNLLELLSNRLRTRVDALDVLVDEGTVCARFSSQETESAAAVCDGECGTLLCALPTFPNLTSLSIRNLHIHTSKRVEEAVCSALSAAAEMQISDVKLRSVNFSRGFYMVPQSPRLCCLTVDSCGIQSFAGFEHHSMLTYLDVSNNSDLRSLHGIAGAPSIENVVARQCGLQDVDGLSQCLQLREVDVSYNHLRSLHGLASAPRLEKVVANGCKLLWDVDGLSQCQHLREVDVSFNSGLRSVRGLAGAPRLEKVVAKCCGLQDVENLSQCPQLREIEVSSNSDLHSLRGLAGAPRLEKVVADLCGLQDVEGLGRCPHLREIDVSENSTPLDLRDLAGGPMLLKIIAENCALLGVEELRSRLPNCKLILQPDRGVWAQLVNERD